MHKRSILLLVVLLLSLSAVTSAKDFSSNINIHNKIDDVKKVIGSDDMGILQDNALVSSSGTFGYTQSILFGPENAKFTFRPDIFDQPLLEINPFKVLYTYQLRFDQPLDYRKLFWSGSSLSIMSRTFQADKVEIDADGKITNLVLLSGNQRYDLKDVLQVNNRQYPNIGISFIIDNGLLKGFDIRVTPVEAKYLKVGETYKDEFLGTFAISLDSFTYQDPMDILLEIVDGTATVKYSNPDGMFMNAGWMIAGDASVKLGTPETRYMNPGDSFDCGDSITQCSSKVALVVVDANRNTHILKLTSIDAASKSVSFSDIIYNKNYQSSVLFGADTTLSYDLGNIKVRFDADGLVEYLQGPVSGPGLSKNLAAVMLSPGQLTINSPKRLDGKYDTVDIYFSNENGKLGLSNIKGLYMYKLSSGNSKGATMYGLYVESMSNSAKVTVPSTQALGAFSIIEQKQGLQNHVIYGNVYVGNAKIADGNVVSARINNVEVARDTTIDGKYGYIRSFEIPADDPGTPGQTGASQGQLVELFVNNVKSAELNFEPGATSILDLRSGSDIVGSQPLCTEDWQCGEWSECVNAQSTRTCSDANNCGTVINLPSTLESCTDFSAVVSAAWSVLKYIFYLVLILIVIVVLLGLYRQLGMLKGVPKHQPNRYIYLSLEQGIDEDSIISNLIHKGWDKKIVEDIVQRENLRHYVKKQLDNGVGEDNLIEYLEGYGWSRESIVQTIAELKQNA